MNSPDKEIHGVRFWMQELLPPWSLGLTCECNSWVHQAANPEPFRIFLWRLHSADIPLILIIGNWIHFSNGSQGVEIESSSPLITCLSLLGNHPSNLRGFPKAISLTETQL